ncbi:MAG TPA: hypothetical protein VIE12_02890, partial [Actinomycetota bacterium]
VDGASPSAGEALDLALELEGREARRDFERATSPRDATLRASLEASSPPPPAPGALLDRLTAARRSLPDVGALARLDRLAEELSGET